MESISPILILILILLVIAVILLLTRKKEVQKDDTGLTLLLEQMNELSRVMDTKLGESRKEMQQAVQTQFSESQKLLREINEQMSRSLVDVAKEQTKTNEATTRFMSIAEQLASLEKTLKHQKQRGNWGEASLELILQNTLAPGQYKMQYQFGNKETVDAAIVTKEGIIPIDAKFSLDNYNRITQAIDERQREELEKEFKNDLKKRIDETAKYIRPEEGTLPFAFMYIPAEGIYYDLLVNEIGAVKVNTRNLIDYAYNDKKVIIVSPTTFMAYLQSVLYGFKAFKIEETAKDIIKRVDELGKHLKAYEDYMTKLGNALGTTVNHYNSAYKELGKVDKDVTRITGSSPELSATLLEKPSVE
ncbi:MAG: DNA recombination protein RmuC [Candidatus Pacebacteria bacterium]|jgi:DNA recombination protein RmuC|nr:DNA recombination protein RmuC [Candidatus Paceibacterota bacterium]